MHKSGLFGDVDVEVAVGLQQYLFFHLLLSLRLCLFAHSLPLLFFFFTHYEIHVEKMRVKITKARETGGIRRAKCEIARLGRCQVG